MFSVDVLNRVAVLHMVSNGHPKCWPVIHMCLTLAGTRSLLLMDMVAIWGINDMDAIWGINEPTRRIFMDTFQKSAISFMYIK